MAFLTLYYIIAFIFVVESLATHNILFLSFTYFIKIKT